MQTQLDMFADDPPPTPLPPPSASRPGEGPKTQIEAFLARNVSRKDDPGILTLEKNLDPTIASYVPVRLELQPGWIVYTEKLVSGPDGARMSLASAVANGAVRVMR